MHNANSIKKQSRLVSITVVINHYQRQSW